MSSPTDADAVFAGSVPQIYDEYLVPLIFETYADDLVARLRHVSSGVVLELACGTGVVTRALAVGLPSDVSIIGSDLNPGMLERAASVGTERPVKWREANALDLPFEDDSIDAVLCQFGVMFFPDKVQAYREAHRVLKPGGTFVFNVWDRIENNEFADEVSRAVATMFPDNPPQFMARTPHGYHDEATIRSELREAGFMSIDWDTVEVRSTARTPDHPAIAYTTGTPLRDEIVSRDASRLDEAVEVATAAVEARWGAGPLDAKIRGFVVTASS